MGGKPPDSGKFKKGKSGNPNGRPKVGNLRDLVQKALEEEGKDGVRSIDKIMAKMKERAEKGDTVAIRELLDRGYGKAIQAMQVSTPEGTGGISIEVNTKKDQKEIADILKKLKDK